MSLKPEIKGRAAPLRPWGQDLFQEFSTCNLSPSSSQWLLATQAHDQTSFLIRTSVQLIRGQRSCAGANIPMLTLFRWRLYLQICHILRYCMFWLQHVRLQAGKTYCTSIFGKCPKEEYHMVELARKFIWVYVPLLWKNSMDFWPTQ